MTEEALPQSATPSPAEIKQVADALHVGHPIVSMATLLQNTLLGALLVAPNPNMRGFGHSMVLALTAIREENHLGTVDAVLREIDKQRERPVSDSDRLLSLTTDLRAALEDPSLAFRVHLKEQLREVQETSKLLVLTPEECDVLLNLYSRAMAAIVAQPAEVPSDPSATP